MLVKMVNAGTVMQDDIGIENKNFFLLTGTGKGCLDRS